MSTKVLKCHLKFIILIFQLAETCVLLKFSCLTVDIRTFEGGFQFKISKDLLALISFRNVLTYWRHRLGILAYLLVRLTLHGFLVLLQLSFSLILLRV